MTIALAQPATKFEILYSEGSDSVVIADTATHDDIAEVFHNERHTVSQTVEQALQTARLFVAAPELYERAVDLIDILSDFEGDYGDPEFIHALDLLADETRAALAKASGEAAQ